MGLHLSEQDRNNPVGDRSNVLRHGEWGNSEATTDLGGAESLLDTIKNAPKRALQKAKDNLEQAIFQIEVFEGVDSNRNAITEVHQRGRVVSRTAIGLNTQAGLEYAKYGVDPDENNPAKMHVSPEDYRMLDNETKKKLLKL